MKAVFVAKDSVDIVDRPIPTPKAGEVLVKNVVAASNPKDWKYVAFLGGPAVVQGNDVAGYIEAVGEGVSGFKKGDKVAAFTDMQGGDRTGAYAEYSIAWAHTTTLLGPKTSFEEAVTLPLAYLTAAIGLFRNVGLDINDDYSSEQIGTLAASGGKKTSVLVYGASSTVGVFVTQLAKKLGLFVVGVAGASADAAKAFGADVVLDYRSKSFEDDLKAAVKEHDVHSAYDAVSEKGSYEHIASAFDANGGGYLTTVLPPAKEYTLPDSVKHKLTYVGEAHTAEEVKPFARKYFTLAGEWLEAGEFKGQKVTVVPGGLGGVAEGLERMKDGKISGEKLVYVIGDTPGLA